MYIEQIPKTSITEFKLKRVAAYARVSSDKDAAEHSLEAQIDYYKNYITGYPGWIFAGIYADNGISGTKDNRPEFQRMLSDCRAGKIDLVITKSITRFARNMVTLLEVIRELKQLDIDIIFEKENMHSISHQGELLLTLLALYAEEESYSASENKHWQIKKYFSEGRPTYFRVYGYNWINEHLEVIPEEAEVVRRIYTEYLDGNGYQSIARRLNADGIVGPTGKWHPNTVREILKNEKYIGNMLLQKYYVEDYRTKKERKNHGEKQMILVENSHEPIIDQAVHDAVQLENASRKRQASGSRATGRDETLFHGLITCKLCGKKYKYKNKLIKSSHTHVPTWICTTSRTLGKEYCTGKQIRESILINKTKQVLHMNEDEVLTRDIITNNIESIESVADNKLRFFLKNGKVEVISWENPSRASSWTPEMKEQARRRAHAAAMQRKETCHE